MIIDGIGIRIKSCMVALEDLSKVMKSRGVPHVEPGLWIKHKNVKHLAESMSWGNKSLPSSHYIIKVSSAIFVCKELALVYVGHDASLVVEVSWQIDRLGDVGFKKEEMECKWNARTHRLENSDVSSDDILNIAHDLVGIPLSESMMMVGMSLPEWLVHNRKFEEADILEDILMLCEYTEVDNAIRHFDTDPRSDNLRRAFKEFEKVCLYQC